MKVLVLLLLLCSLSVTSVNSQSWSVLEDSARYYKEKKNAERSVQFYQLAKEKLPADSAVSSTAIRLNQSAGDTWRTASQFKKAYPFLLEVRRLTGLLSGDASAPYATSDDNIGIVLYFNGDYDEAIPFLQESLRIREKLFGSESAEYAQSCNLLGALYIRLSSFNEAEKFHHQAKTIRERIAKEKKTDAAMLQYAQSCNNLADVYRELGEYEKAEPLAIEARDIRKKFLKPPHFQYAISCTNLANIYTNLGQYKKAEKLYIEAKDIREQINGKQHTDYAASCNILADLYSYTGEFDKAEALYKEAKDIREALFTKENPDYAQSCNNLAGLYLSMKQYDKAEPLALEAHTTWEKTLDADDPVLAYSLTNLGQLYTAMKQFDKAENYFQRARPLWDSAVGREHPSFISNSIDLGKLYWNTRQFSKADSYFTESFTTQRRLTDKIFRFTNEAEKQQYLENITGSNDDYYSFYSEAPFATQAGNPYQLSLFSRNLILSSSQQLKQSIYSSGDSLLNKKYNDWMGLKQQLAHLYSKGNGTQEQIDKLENAAALVEKELARHSSLFDSTANRLVEWTDIKKNLKPSEASIEFIQFKHSDGLNITGKVSLIAILLRSDAPAPILVPLCEKNRLDSLLKRGSPQNINALYRLSQNGALSTANAQKTYDLIWKPLEKHLGGISTIYFAPSGDLFKISFAALRMDENISLSDRYTLVQLNTTASVLKPQKEIIDSSNTILLYGGISYDADPAALKKAVARYAKQQVSPRSLPGDLQRGSGFEFLPGSEAEVNSVKTFASNVKIKASVLSGIQASEESFKALNGKNSPSILHIATHGFLFPDPQLTKASAASYNRNVFRESDNPLFRSGLLFAGANNTWKRKAAPGIEDGILTAYEVANMYLPNTKLVVLSACETALGEIHGSEGVYGLQRAFKIAGVQHLVMSLWEVPDDATAEFMQEFYKNIFKQQPVNQAFYNTQTTMKNKYRAEPFKWAAWILVQ
jgi:CHAT domain-containing protein